MVCRIVGTLALATASLSLHAAPMSRLNPASGKNVLTFHS
jgi:hypothetical protein